MIQGAAASGHGSEDGFSLVEMLVVLSILALVAALFFPSLQNRREPTALATAQQIHALLLRARTDAIARGRRKEVVIDLDAGTVRYGPDHVVTIPQSFERSLLVGRDLMEADGAARLLFLPDGGSSGAELAFQSTQGIATAVSVPWLAGIPSIGKHPSKTFYPP